MPLYEYRCDTCGEFEAWRAIAELGTPMYCPECQAVGKRIFSPPNISLNSGSLASKRGESTEPRLVKREEPAAPRYQSSSGGRPWMIGHAPPR